MEEHRPFTLTRTTCRKGETRCIYLVRGDNSVPNIFVFPFGLRLKWWSELFQDVLCQELIDLPMSIGLLYQS